MVETVWFDEFLISEVVRDLSGMYQAGFKLSNSDIHWLVAVASGRRASEAIEASFGISAGKVWCDGREFPCMIDVEVFMDLVEYIKTMKLKAFPYRNYNFNSVGLVRPRDCRNYYRAWVEKYHPQKAVMAMGEGFKSIHVFELYGGF